MNYYKVLEINKDASIDEIKKSYKKLALKWHPDRNKSNKAYAEEKFKQISEAYAILSDPEKKKMYDRYGVDGVKNKFPNSTDNSFFEAFFKENGYTYARDFDAKYDNNWQQTFKLPKSPPVYYDLNCNLYDLYHGCIKKFKLSNNQDYTILRNKEVEIDIKKGWKEGTKITFENMQCKKNMRPGDLIFIIKQINKKGWLRVDNNLHHTVKIDLQTAKNGKKYKLHHINGKIYDVYINPMKSSKEFKMIENLGMPDKNGVFGNLIIDFDIDLNNNNPIIKIDQFSVAEFQ